jgi:hypothetical protein
MLIKVREVYYKTLRLCSFPVCSEALAEILGREIEC